MKKIKFLLLIPIFLLICGCNSNEYIKNVSTKDIEKMIENKETFILEVMRDNCSACTSFKPRLNNVTKKYKVNVAVVNTNKNDISKITNVEATPTLVFFNEGVEESVSTRVVGAVSEEKLITRLKTMGYIK